MTHQSPTSSRKRVLGLALVAVVASVVAAACGSGEHAPGLNGPGDGVCVDKDGDGFGTGCWAGPDCDDADPKVVCNGKSPCEANEFAPGCTCPEDGATHACGKVTEKSGDYLTCGYGSVRCSSGAWTDCSIDAKRSGFLGMQRILALGAPTACVNNPCDPYCMQFIDKPDRTILHDGGRGLPEGGFRFTDGGLTLSPADGYTFPPAFPDGAPPPAPPLTPPPSDLTVTSFTCTPSVEVGSTVSCDVTVANTGGAWAPTFTNDLRLSTDATIDGTDTLLEYCGVSALDPAGTITLTCAGTIPAGTAPGSLFAGFIVDSGATVTESNETNNTASAPVSVVPSTIPPPPPPPPMADLVVTAFTCTAPVSAGGTLACTATIQNTGGSFAPLFDNGLRLSPDGTIDTTDTLLGDCTVSALSALGTVTVTCAGTVPGATAVGPYTVGIVVDSGGAVPESNEANNTFTTTVTVSLPAPPVPADLRVTAVTCVSGTYAAGETVSCLVDVVNGGGSWARPFEDELHLSVDATIDGTDTLLGLCGIPGLNPGATATVNCAGTIPVVTAPGAFNVGFIADSTDAVPESIETNNTGSKPVTVTAGAPALTPADLVVQSITCPGPVEAGSSAACTVVLRNAGGSWAAAAFGNDLYLSADGVLDGADINIGSCSASALMGGATVTLTCAATIPSGTAAAGWNIIINEDSTNTVAESNEGNNTGVAALTVSAPAVSAAPDIVVSAVACTPASQNAGAGLSCSVKFTNQGAGNAAAFTSSLRLSVDPTISTGDPSLTGVTCNTGALGSGASSTVACTGSVPGGAGSGFYYVGVIADSAGAVTESNEGNNTNYTFVTVPAASQAFILPPGMATPTQPTSPPLVTKTNGIEVFFLLDISGTMQAALAQLQSSMVNVVSNIHNGFAGYPAIPTAKFGVGHFSGYDQDPYNQNGPYSLVDGQSTGGGAKYQRPLPFYTVTAIPPAGGVGVGQTLLPVQNAAGVASTSAQARDAILAWDPAAPTAPYRTRAPNHDEPESWTFAAFAEMTTAGLYRAAGPTYWVPPRPGGLCPAGAIGYPCFSAGATPLTVLFTDNPSPNGPGGLFAYAHDAPDAGFVGGYQPVAGTQDWPAATPVNNNFSEANAITLDPTQFQRFKGPFSGSSTITNATLGYYNGTRNFPTSYADWYTGTGDARDLCGYTGSTAAGGEAFYKFSLSERTYLHFDTFGSNTAGSPLDTYLYIIDRTAAHAGDGQGRVVACQDYLHALYVDGGPNGRIYTSWVGGPVAHAADSGSFSTTSGVNTTDLNAYLDAGDYTLVVDRKTGTGGNYFLTVNADPERSTQPISPGAAPPGLPTMPTFDQMVNAHKAAGGSIIGVDVSGMGPVNAAGTAFTHCTNNYKVGHRTDRWTYVTMQEAARETGAVNDADANFWTNPYVFSVDMNGQPCLPADAPLDQRISTAILDLTSNNLRADVAFRAVDTDDATDFDGPPGGTPLLTPTNCAEGVNGTCAGTAYARPLGVFVNSATPAANARCQDDTSTDGVLEGCLPGTNVTFNAVYGVPAGFPQLCNDQVFKFDVEAYVKTATCTPGVDCYSMGTKPVTIVVPGNSTLCPAAGAADLVVSAMTCTTPVDAGSTLSCSVTVQNTGSLDSAAFTSRLVLSGDATIASPPDVSLGTCGSSGIAAGGQRTITCTGTVPAGTAPGGYNGGIIVDSTGAVAESNEANNTGSATVTVSAAPTVPPPADIVVTSVTCQQPPSVPRGGTLTCDVVLTNGGNTATGAFGNQLRLSTNATIDATDALLGNCGVPTLAAGGTVTVRCSGSVPTATVVGPWFAGIIADPAPPATGLVAETNEANNTGSWPFAVVTAPVVPPPADIEVTTVTCPPTVAKSDTLTCDVTFTNRGSTASGPFENDLRLSQNPDITAADPLVGHCGVANLDPGASITVKCSGPVIPASLYLAGFTYYPGVMADSTGVVAEITEANNVNYTSVAMEDPPITPPLVGPDLVVTTVKCPANVPQGGTLTCDVTFTNSGASVAGTFMNELRLSSDATIDATDTVIGNCGLSGLAVGTPVTVKCGGMVAASTATGAWYAGAVADTTATVAENDETNNTLSTAVTVDAAPVASAPPGADIVVESVVCAPASLNPGVTTTCTVLLKNQGGTDAGAFANEIRLSLDRTIDATDSLLGTCAAAALPAGSTETITCAATIPATATRGVYYYVGVMADSPGVVTESNETNNNSFTPILVAAPPPAYGSAWYERDYDGRNLCPRGYSPVWGLFSWNANTPKDSHIDFSVQTAPTNAELNTAQSAAMAVVARATAATPPGYGGGKYPALTDTADTQTGSVIVNTVLEGETLPAQDVWLRVQANLVSSSDHTAPPSLSAWGLQVGCVASQ